MISIKRILISLYVLLAYATLNGQSLSTVNFKDERVNLKTPPSKGLTFTYQLKEKIIYYDGKPYAIIPNNSFRKEPTMFGFIPFEHGDSGIPNMILFLVTDYEKELSKLIVDINANLDFNDDPVYINFNRDSTAYLTIHHSNIKNVNVSLDLNKMVYKNKEHEQKIASFANTEVSTSINNQLLPARYWMTETLYNYRIAENFEDLALFDINNNGIFNDVDVDKILVSDSIGIRINDRKQIFRYTVGKDTIIEFRMNKYRIKEIAENGDQAQFIKLGNKDTTMTTLFLRAGMKLPDFKFLTTFEKEINFSELRPVGKYVLIDFWGTWCKPCLEAVPSLKELKGKYGDQLEILGLAFQENRAQANQYTNEHGLNWLHGFADQALIDKFKVIYFPFYILIDKDDKIIDINFKLSNAPQLLR